MSEEQTQQKYTYKFRLEAQRVQAPKNDEASQADLQAYINDVLGIKRPQRTEQQITA
ncbi:MAG TPA: hypothetical protein VFE91_06040 [Nitrososphaerales archaeon]|nr:hypothetical protein [Nitrososphaerales archaeon]